MAGRSLIIRAGFALCSLIALLAVGEVGLRLLQRPFAPAEFQARNAAQAASAGEFAGVPVAFDPVLFWRRAARTPPRREPGDFLVLVLGDGDALGLAGTKGPWPDTLSYLIGLNETVRPVLVENAAEPGYSSFQGVQRFAQLAGLRPDLVCFAFGRADARQVFTADAEYARRLESLGRLSGSWLALRVAHGGWGWLARGAATPRVPLDEFRTHAAAFLRRARALGATPVLIAGGPRPYDAALESEAARERVRVLESPGRVQLAEALLDFLTEEGIVLSRRRRAASIELARASDAQPELGGAWLAPELRPEAASGRRFEREGRLELERLSVEQGVAVDLTCPPGFVGWVEAGGARHDLSDCRGREWRRLAIGAEAGKRVEVRFVPEGPSSDALRVHTARLVPSDVPARIENPVPYAAELDLAQSTDERPELGQGFWPRETWSDGRRGRWTAREAALWLARRGEERGLVLDLSLQNPDNVTACRVEANGEPVYEFRTRNGRHRFGIDVQRVAGRVVHVRLIVGRTFVPGHGDDRALGLFVHSARLAASEVP